MEPGTFISIAIMLYSVNMIAENLEYSLFEKEYSDI